jgi:hypothetical protein
MIIFFDIKEIIHKEFVLADQIVYSAQYRDVHGDCMKMCEDFASLTWLFNHDNGLFHTSFFTREYFTKNNITVVPHLCYSTDLVPRNFSVFPIEDAEALEPELTVVSELTTSRVMVVSIL